MLINNHTEAENCLYTKQFTSTIFKNKVALKCKFRISLYKLIYFNFWELQIFIDFTTFPIHKAREDTSVTVFPVMAGNILHSTGFSA